MTSDVVLYPVRDEGSDLGGTVKHKCVLDVETAEGDVTIWEGLLDILIEAHWAPAITATVVECQPL